MSTRIANEYRLPFGKHAGRPLGDVPADYLRWALSTCKLSSGLRAALSAELSRRGIDPPPAPPPIPPRIPACRCGSDRFRVLWQEDRGGKRRIRAECSCGRYLCFLPQREPWIALADAVASPTPILDALTQLEDIGVDLRSDGKTVWFAGDDWRRVPPNLRAIVRQCNHQLARMMGDTRERTGQEQ